MKIKQKQKGDDYFHAEIATVFRIEIVRKFFEDFIERAEIMIGIGPRTNLNFVKRST